MKHLTMLNTRSWSLVGAGLLALIAGIIMALAIAPAAAAGAPWTIYLEAEAGSIVAPMVAIDDEAASACGYVSSLAGENGTTTMSFTLTEPRRVYLWGRTRAPHHGANSLYVSVDGGAETRWDFPVEPNWIWNRVRDALTGMTPGYDLGAGTHSVRVRAREANSPLDVLAVSEDWITTPGYVAPCGPTSTPTETKTPTKSPTPTYSPTTGPTPTITNTPAGTHTPTATATATDAPGMIYVEAEAGSLAAPMSAHSDTNASACSYVSSPLGGAGFTTLTFTLSEAGNYWFWGRTRAEHSGANSLYISVDNSPEFRWDFSVTPNWTWAAIKDALTGAQRFFPLGAGAHTIRIRTREGNSPLDVIAIGLDRYATPNYVAPCGPTSTPTVTNTPIPTNSPTVGPTSTWTDTPISTYTPTATATATDVPGMVYVEGEVGSLTAPMASHSDTKASACANVSSPLGGSGFTTLTFTLSEAGNYWFWGRTRAEHSGANPFFVSVDNSPEFRWDFSVTPNWTWAAVKDALTGFQRFFSLGAGAHTIRIRTREGNSPLDVIAIGLDRYAMPNYVAPCGPTSTPTNTPTPTNSPTTGPTATETDTPVNTYTPTDTPPATDTPTPTSTPTLGPGTTYVEAESGFIDAPMTTASDSQASACGYVYSTSGYAGSTTLTFTAGQAGTYYLWGRTRADHSGMNSFFVSVDGGQETRWDFAVTPGWSWNPVKDAYTGARKTYALSAGAHDIRFRSREGGSSLDIVAITDQLSLIPDYIAGCGTSTTTSTPTASGTPTSTPTVTHTATIGPTPTSTDTPNLTITPTPTPFGIVRVEAEEAETLVEPMIIGNDLGASRCMYVYTPDGGPIAGHFVTPFSVPMVGAYQIWGRVRTPDAGSNALYVSIDGEPEYQWIPPVHTDWTWTQVTNLEAGGGVSQYLLTEGVHYVWVRTREAGSQLDALEFVYQGPGGGHIPSYVAPCGPATSTPTPTSTYTITPTPTTVPYTETLVLQKGMNGYEAVIDTTLDYDYPTNNLGTSSSLYLEGFARAQALIRYDLSALPASARVVSATLGVYVIPDARPERRQPLTSTVYALTRSWSEMEANWMQASNGNAWGVPGAYDPGTDYAPWPSDEIWFYESTPQSEFTERWFTYTVMSLVQGWIDHPATNEGFVIKARWPHAITYPLRSSDYWHHAYRPRLQIIYYPGD